MKKLLIVAHAPSKNTELLRDALVHGAREEADNELNVECLSPFECKPEDVLAADGIILSTPENLGYMSGALKDFFDRIYYPCLEKTQGLPVVVLIRAGNDGTGTAKAIDTIITGLRWKAVAEPVICKGDFQLEFTEQCEELGRVMAVGVAAGVL